jgi:hypothetical protein
VHTQAKKVRNDVAAAAAHHSPVQKGFTDSNSKWLKPKAVVSKEPPSSRKRSRLQPTASSPHQPSTSQSGTSSDDKPLPGELSDSEGDSLLLSSDNEGDLDTAVSMGDLSASSDGDFDDATGLAHMLYSLSSYLVNWRNPHSLICVCTKIYLSPHDNPCQFVIGSFVLEAITP